MGEAASVVAVCAENIGVCTASDGVRGVTANTVGICDVTGTSS
jgi:hypothetical protein